MALFKFNLPWDVSDPDAYRKLIERLTILDARNRGRVCVLEPYENQPPSRH